MRSFAFLCFFTLSAGIVGCGAGNAPVKTSGSVTWEDGSPVVAASLRFVPVKAGEGREAAGFTGKDGEFVMSTFSQGDGALRGEYVVLVTKTDAAAPPSTVPAGSSPEEMMKAMRKFSEENKVAAKKAADSVPANYASDKTSPLRWKVETENAKVELKIKK